jgi:hypothetical protein
VDVAAFRSMRQQLDDFDEDYAKLQLDCDERLEEMQSEKERSIQEV